MEKQNNQPKTATESIGVTEMQKEERFSDIVDNIDYGDIANKNVSLMCHRDGDTSISVHRVTSAKMSGWREYEADEDSSAFRVRSIVIKHDNGKVVTLSIFEDGKGEVK